MRTSLDMELEQELLESDYKSSLESDLADFEAEAESTIPRDRCTPVGVRVGKFNCSAAERSQIRAFLRISVSVATLRAALESAAGRAVSLAMRAANALDKSRRNATTRRIFCEAFGVTPEFVPPWRASLRGVVRWRDLGELVAIRLRDVAKILDGGCIHYFCWGSPAHCPECTGSPTAYFACSSFRGRYIICLGGLFWRAWRSGDTVTTSSTLLHEALHIYFGRTVSDRGRSGNANCYERFAVRLQNLFFHPATAANCPAGSCAPDRELEQELEEEYPFALELDSPDPALDVVEFLLAQTEINKQLQRNFRADDEPGYLDRRRRLRLAFQSVPKSHVQKLLGRLLLDTSDPLTKLFRYKLHPATQGEMISRLTKKLDVI
jgi:hypothetical protein